MGLPALIIATLCYVVAAADLGLRKKDWAMCLVYAAYAVANCGLIWVAYRERS